MKILKNWSLQFSSIFMNPAGTWKFIKTVTSFFINFYDPMEIHKNQTLLFSSIWNMEIYKNQSLLFSSILMTGYIKSIKISHFNFHRFSWTRGTWKFIKISHFIFHQFSWPRVHKIYENQSLQFSSIFMTPGTWKFIKIRHMKIEVTDFYEFPCTRGHENWWK